MKWLELSADRFEPIPDIQFSLKKPLFAASVVLTYERGDGEALDGPVRGFAELHAKIPLKRAFHYSLETLGRDGDATFAFAKVWERDESGGNVRVTTSHASSVTVESGSIAKMDARENQGSVLNSGAGVADASVKTIEVRNDSPAPILSHLLTFPAFQQTRDFETSLYGGHIFVGSRIYALRIERVGSTADFEDYEVRVAKVAYALDEAAWTALDWKSHATYGFKWDVEKKTLTAARFHVPIIGQIEIKA